MPRQTNKMQIGEALNIFGFKFGTEISKEIITKKFRELSFKHHPDKNPKADVKLFTKIVEAKEVLLRDFQIIKANTQTIIKANSIFVDMIINLGVKPKQNPFTVYQKGQNIK